MLETPYEGDGMVWHLTQENTLNPTLTKNYGQTPPIFTTVYSTERNNTHDQVLPQYSYKVPIPNQYIFGEKTLK